MEPFSDNIIFFDTEFSSLNPYKGEILSIGLVKLDGSELYLELKYDGPVNDWVKENILPNLNRPKVSREKAREEIIKFVGQAKPYVVGFVPQFDMIYLYKLFAKDDMRMEIETPLHWLPIDFASLIFASGKNPEEYLDFAKSLGVSQEGYHIHNALDDAKLLREVYMKLFKLKVQS